MKAAVPVQRPRVAVVASVAAPPAQKPKTATGPTDIHTHGVTYGGRLKTWTGGVYAGCVALKGVQWPGPHIQTGGAVAGLVKP
jgi:hypothetical protein